MGWTRNIVGGYTLHIVRKDTVVATYSSVGGGISTAIFRVFIVRVNLEEVVAWIHWMLITPLSHYQTNEDCTVVIFAG
jgi:hypothetical protein